MGTNRQEQQAYGGGLHIRSSTACVLPLLLIAAALTLMGCASTIADHTPTVAGGLPEGAPARPSTPSAYPAVNDLPPPRSSSVLSSAEQQKLQNELAEARNRAAASANANAGTAKPAGGSAPQ